MGISRDELIDLIKSILLMTLLLLLLSTLLTSCILQAEEYQLELINRIDINKFIANSKFQGNFSPDYQSYLTTAMIDGDEGHTYGQLYDSLGNILWEGELGS